MIVYYRSVNLQNLYLRGDLNLFKLDIPNQETIRCINNFTSDVFNHFNGRINLFNTPARLIIDWSLSQDKRVAGTSLLPNVITIYPSVILRECEYDFDSVNHQIIITILHELYHTDQYIDYPRMKVDPAYYQDIECAADTEAHLFIAQHALEIERLFGTRNFVNSRKIVNICSDLGFFGHYYNRKTYQSHIMSIVRDMQNEIESDLYDKLEPILEDPNTTLEVIIEDNSRFILKKKMDAMPLQQFNDILYFKYYQYNFHGTKLMLHGYPDINFYSLIIKTKCSNRLYRVVK